MPDADLRFPSECQIRSLRFPSELLEAGGKRLEAGRLEGWKAVLSLSYYGEHYCYDCSDDHMIIYDCYRQFFMSDHMDHKK